MIQLSDYEFRTLMHCAFRYALGRRSYMVSDVCDLIKKYANSPGMPKDQIIREVRLEASLGSIGDSCDHEEWISLVSELEKKVE